MLLCVCGGGGDLQPGMHIKHCMLLQYHISKVSLSETQTMNSASAMDDLESALQSLEVKMEGESSSASEMLVRHDECIMLSFIQCH